MGNVQIKLGRWTAKDLEDSLRESRQIQDPGERTASLSCRLLGISYEASTLKGSSDSAEVFVINLEGVDCFTFLDYVEAMRRSSSYPEFVETLKKVRYKEGKVSFSDRNHFFTDWVETHSAFIEDVTGNVGAEKAAEVRKLLNRKKDGSAFVPGIGAFERQITFIPTDAIDDAVISRMKTGDYAGIYSGEQGLDVSHVGIISKEGQTVKFRHASSAPGKRMVIDDDFLEYMKDKPGIIILRPKNADK